MGPIGYPEKWVTIYWPKTHNVSEERSPQLLSGGNLKYLIFGGVVEWLQLAQLVFVGAQSV
jgi:hypothetical protein